MKTLLSGPPLILASQSTSRQALLRAAGIEFTSHPARVDEEAYKASYAAEQLSAGDAAIGLAEVKALKVSRRFPDALVIGADQMLECQGRWFDKPEDREAARAQLLALRGQTHHLLSAVVIAHNGERIWHTLSRASLTLRAFSEGFLDAYLASVDDSVLGCVGGYQVEGLGIQLFEQIDGDHSTILGLPLLPVLDFLRNWGSVAK